MTFSASRLTCYALISAMESDIRALVEERWPELTLDDLPDDVVKAAQERRAKDKLPAAKTIAAILPYTDFADSFEIISPRRADLPAAAKQSIQSLAEAFARMVTIRNQVAHTKPMRLDDAAFVADQATQLCSDDTTIWSTLSETMKRITENPAYVLGLTPTWRVEEAPGTPFHNLPIPEFDETGFFGRNAELKKLKKLIKGNYAIVSVLGNGGIGKTALTVQAAYELLDDPDRPFEAIVWVTAKSAVLTGTEIVSITNAIKDSLGLFSQATELLGGKISGDPVEDLRSYLETFKVLLILDNLETVLDPVLREFLADTPVGSKVIITSRISLGMLDNPIALGPLTPDDAINLLYALCRARGVQLLKGLARDDVASYAEQMSGHPSYIRWFVAGVQAGKRPEDLLGDNGLILDYCMSNVYDYLDQDQRDVLGVFQVLPGPKNMAEIASLSNLNGHDTERILLGLLTTNFLSMSSQSSSGILNSTYFLSDFAKEYLDRWHPVDRHRRAVIIGRSQALKDQGMAFSAEMAAMPYSAETVIIRGGEDAHVARLLKQAILAPRDEEALALCREAQKLAPHYAESYRVEGYIRVRMLDDSGALEAYERALALSEMPSIRYHFGSYLLDERLDVKRALTLLQEAARADVSSPEISSQIAWAHYLSRDWVLAFGAAKQVHDLPKSIYGQRVVAAVIALRAACQKVGHELDCGRPDVALEFAEDAIELAEGAGGEVLSGEATDLLLLLRRQIVGELTNLSGYYRSSSERSIGRLDSLIDRDGANLDRIVSHIAWLVPEKGYGFVAAEPEKYFLHVSELVDRDMCDSLQQGERCIFDPRLVGERRRACNVRILRL